MLVSQSSSTVKVVTTQTLRKRRLSIVVHYSLILKQTMTSVSAKCWPQNPPINFLLLTTIMWSWRRECLSPPGSAIVIIGT